MFFGDPYLSLEEYRKYADEPDGFLYVAEEEGEIASASLLFGEDRETLSEDMEIEEADWNRFCKGRGGARLKFVWTREEFKGRGLANETLNAALMAMEGTGRFGAVFTQLWVPKENVVPFENTAKKQGFTFYRHQIEPWYKEKYAHCRCSICGGMCRCNADVYVKEF